MRFLRLAVFLIALILAPDVLAELTLSAALDAPGAVTWTTSQPIGFVAQVLTGAKNGSAAVIDPPPLPSDPSEVWLEARVTGPGWFDFWVLPIVGGQITSASTMPFQVTVDGVAMVQPTGSTWPALLVTGSSQHVIRFKFPTSNARNMSWGLDDVSWQPLSASASVPVTGDGNGQATWSLSQGGVYAFADGGYQNAPQFVLSLRPEQRGTLTAAVDGPAELSWRQSSKPGIYYTVSRVVVDGMQSHNIDRDDIGLGWKECRLAVPAGPHTVNWEMDANLVAYYEGIGNLPKGALSDESSLQISHLSVSAASPLAEALDDSTHCILAYGDDAGRVATNENGAEGGKAWALPNGTVLARHGSIDSARLFHRWREVEPGMSGLRASPSDLWPLWSVTPWIFTSTAWQRAAWSPAESNRYWKLQSVQAGFDAASGVIVDVWREEPSSSATVSETLGIAPASNSGWMVIQTPAEARTGQSVVWSQMPASGAEPPKLQFNVTGPGTFAGWWRKSSSGNLSLLLDKSKLSVSSLGETWTKFELQLGDGDHTLDFVNQYERSSSNDLPQEAWLADFTFARRDSPWGFSEVLGGTLTGFTSTEKDGVSWRPLVLNKGSASEISGAYISNSSAELQLTVSGPGVLTYQSQFTGKEDFLLSPFGGYQSLSHGLLCEGVMNQKRLQRRKETWETIQMPLVEGPQKISWSLRSISGSLFGESLKMSAEGYAVIRQVSFESRGQHYAKWRLSNGLPVNSLDFDGDGVPDIEEYVFDSDPKSALSRPAAMNFSASDANSMAHSPHRFLIPWPSPGVGLSLESSVDLRTWIPVKDPIPSAYFPLADLDLTEFFTEHGQYVYPPRGSASIVYRVRSF